MLPDIPTILWAVQVGLTAAHAIFVINFLSNISTSQHDSHSGGKQAHLSGRRKTEEEHRGSSSIDSRQQSSGIIFPFSISHCLASLPRNNLIGSAPFLLIFPNNLRPFFSAVLHRTRLLSWGKCVQGHRNSCARPLGRSSSHALLR